MKLERNLLSSVTNKSDQWCMQGGMWGSDPPWLFITLAKRFEKVGDYPIFPPMWFFFDPPPFINHVYATASDVQCLNLVKPLCSNWQYTNSNNHNYCYELCRL